jgi:glutamate N-acetyltransferase / amino-acid N-acetyltransferase
MTPAPAEAAKNTRSVVVDRKTIGVPGFQVSAVHAGIRYRERADLALIAADDVAVAAGVFTQNQFPAAPVLLCKEHLGSQHARAIVINSGIANAGTGLEGLVRAREMASITARALGVAEETVLVCSTGVIGQQIPLEAVEQAMPTLTATLRDDAWDDVARAIMTTDTVPKAASTRLVLDGKTVTITGVAKGAGMIAPNMATLLAFVCTDAKLTGPVLDYWTRTCADVSFNRITIDGDTSTNDTLLVIAGGRADHDLISDPHSESGELFGKALGAVLLDLAKQIVRDGEGVTKFIEVRVTGAADSAGARAIAFTIANSPLVKTAFFGEDANWGRIIAAAGRAGIPLQPERVALHFDEVCVFRGGTPVIDPAVEQAATQVFRRKEIVIHLEVGLGQAEYRVYTCDLSYDYVKINASYRS